MQDDRNKTKGKGQKKHNTLRVKSDIQDCNSTVQGAEIGGRTRFRSEKKGSCRSGQPI